MQEPPTVRFVCGQRELKGEDVAFAHEEWQIGGCTWHLFSVCDGHGGPGAANFIEKNLLNVLATQLPCGAPPPWNSVEGREWAFRIAKALQVTFVSLDEEFAKLGCSSGTTVSVALLCNWLLTTANIGDSEVFLDMGVSIEEMTKCHKVHTNYSEQQRLVKWGAVVDSLSQTMLGPPKENEQGIGPLRAWPGGVAVSRSLGDFDCCRHVVPVPHVRQIVIPPTGARLLLASDGLWDFLTGVRACKIARKARLEKAPARLFRALMFQTDGILLDDTTIMLVDILPKANVEFRDAVKEAKKARKKGLFSKFRRVLHNMFSDEPSKPMELYADLDGLLVFPHIASRGFNIYASQRSKIVEVQPPTQGNVMANISVKDYQMPHLLDEERMAQIQKAVGNPADIFDDVDDEDEYCDICGGNVENDKCTCYAPYSHNKHTITTPM